ncbi:hypothetical protein ACFVH0_32575 [Streptomyces sp. NPDC127117]|uniref:hypothetical protein n=1 Tax=Streptomyces sp. NPDC127117 TaxID=3345368 RepID=UPI00363A5901
MSFYLLTGTRPHPENPTKHSHRPRTARLRRIAPRSSTATSADTRDWSKRQSHPHLCEHCQHQSVTAEAKQQAKTRAEERERQEQERLRQEAEEQAAAQKAGGWLSRFHT